MSPFSSFDGRQQTFIFSVLVIVSMLTNMGFLIIAISLEPYQMYGNIQKIVSYSFVVTLVFSNLSANVQCYYYKSVYKRISRQILTMESIFKAKFRQHIRFQAFANRYKSKVLAIFISLSIDLTLKFYESWIQHDFELFIKYCFSCLVQCMSNLIICHALLYISIVQMFITELNGRIRSTPIRLSTSGKMDLLKTIKLMHMEIWKLIAQINKFFSFNLTFYIIALAAQTTYYLYWFFLILQVKWNLLYIFRE